MGVMFIYNMCIMLFCYCLYYKYNRKNHFIGIYPGFCVTKLYLIYCGFVLPLNLYNNYIICVLCVIAQNIIYLIQLFVICNVCNLNNLIDFTILGFRC